MALISGEYMLWLTPLSCCLLLKFPQSPPDTYDTVLDVKAGTASSQKGGLLPDYDMPDQDKIKTAKDQVPNSPLTTTPSATGKEAPSTANTSSGPAAEYSVVTKKPKKVAEGGYYDTLVHDTASTAAAAQSVPAMYSVVNKPSKSSAVPGPGSATADGPDPAVPPPPLPPPISETDLKAVNEGGGGGAVQNGPKVSPNDLQTHKNTSYQLNVPGPSNGMKMTEEEMLSESLYMNM